MTRIGFLLALALPLAAAACSDNNVIEEPTRTEADALASAEFRITRWVTDQADLLDRVQEERLARVLSDLERSTGHQMAVVTVTSLQGREVADYTRGLANRSGIGRREEDDGVVLLIAPNERQARIEVGIGLESVLTNQVCHEIMGGIVIPKFTQADFAGGIEAGVEALIARLENARVSRRSR